MSTQAHEFSLEIADSWRGEIGARVPTGGSWQRCGNSWGFLMRALTAPRAKQPTTAPPQPAQGLPSGQNRLVRVCEATKQAEGRHGRTGGDCPSPPSGSFTASGISPGCPRAMAVDGMARILVLGGGFCGLAAGLMLARDDHEVTVLERDPEPVPASADDAWERWPREGVTQFRLAHFLAPGGRAVLEGGVAGRATGPGRRGRVPVRPDRQPPADAGRPGAAAGR